MADLNEFDVPDTFNQTSILVDRHLEEGRAEEVAIYYEDREITYGQLAEMVNRSGNAFIKLGVEIENRIMIILPDCPELIYSYLGAMRIGAVPVPVNTKASMQDYLYFLNDSRARVLVVTSEVLPMIQDIKEQLKYLKEILVVGPASGEETNFNELIQGTSADLDIAENSKDDMAFWMYTSGTTGLPKGVVHLHQDLPYYMVPVEKEVLKLRDGDRIYCTSKMFFAYGRNNSLETPLFFGCPVILDSKWPSPQDVFNTIQRYRPTLFYSVPTFYAALLRELENENHWPDFSSVRLCVSAGEALPKYIYERWKDLLGVEIIDVVGSTDVGGMYLGNRPGRARPGSSGKLMPGFEGKLMDSEGQPVAPGETGALWLSNDGIADRYWNRHKRSKEVFMGQWFNTGDLFYQDDDGYFWYQGREDDMLKVSGQWVSPLEIEEILKEHPQVREAGVVGRPDDAGLIRVSAFVVLNAGNDGHGSIKEELTALVYDRIAHFKVPRWVEVVPELPRTTTGKLQRHKLRLNI